MFRSHQFWQRADLLVQPWAKARSSPMMVEESAGLEFAIDPGESDLGDSRLAHYEILREPLNGNLKLSRWRGSVRAQTSGSIASRCAAARRSTRSGSCVASCTTSRNWPTRDTRRRRGTRRHGQLTARPAHFPAR